MENKKCLKPPTSYNYLVPSQKSYRCPFSLQPSISASWIQTRSVGAPHLLRRHSIPNTSPCCVHKLVVCLPHHIMSYPNKPPDTIYPWIAGLRYSPFHILSPVLQGCETTINPMVPLALPATSPDIFLEFTIVIVQTAAGCWFQPKPGKEQSKTQDHPISPWWNQAFPWHFLDFFFTSQIHLDLPMFSPRFAKFTIESGIQPPTGVQPASKSWQLSESRWAVSRRVLQMATASTQKPWRLTASPGRGDHHAGFMMNDGKIWQMMMILWCFINFVSPFWI